MGEMCEEGAREPEISEQQQAAMQQEERVLTEQIENLQKEKYALVIFVFFRLFCLLNSSHYYMSVIKWNITLLKKYL